MGMIEMTNITGRRIRQMRKHKGFTLEKLAHELKVSASAVSQYERGIITPSSVTLMKIARALKCSVRDIASNEAAAKVEELMRDPCSGKSGAEYVSLKALEAELERLMQRRGVKGWTEIAFDAADIDMLIHEIPEEDIIVLDDRGK